MKNIFTLIVLLLISANISAQIGFSKSKIIQEYENYESEINENGVEIITTFVEYENYKQFLAFYFTNIERVDEQLCYKVLMIEPKSETNNWIKYFNEQNFIKLDGMVWKDYENSIVYEVSVEEGSCIVIKYYDTKL